MAWAAGSSLQFEIGPFSEASIGNVEDNEFDIGVGNFDYWRGTFGLTFRW